MRYYVYLSPVKISMLFGQIPTAMTKKLVAELKLSIGVASATLKTNQVDTTDLPAKLALVEAYLDREGTIRTVEYPGEYIRDSQSLLSGVLFDYAAG